MRTNAQMHTVVQIYIVLDALQALKMFSASVYKSLLRFADQLWGMGEGCDDAAEEGKAREQNNKPEGAKEPKEGKEEIKEPTPALQPGTKTSLTALTEILHDIEDT